MFKFILCMDFFFLVFDIMLYLSVCYTKCDGIQTKYKGKIIGYMIYADMWAMKTPGRKTCIHFYFMKRTGQFAFQTTVFVMFFLFLFNFSQYDVCFNWVHLWATFSVDYHNTVVLHCALYCCYRVVV